MDLLTELRTRRALCIVRASRVPDPAGLAGTLVGAGLPMIEIAFTTPDAARVIERASTVDGAVLGAGTVLTAAMARDAANAGATFLFTPGLRPEVATEAARLGLPVVLGAFTPTEVAAAVDAGAAAVKVFPAARLGPTYLRDLHGPYPDVPLVASGGINAGNAAAYLAAGAIAVTAGSSVIPPDPTDLGQIRLRADEFVAAVTPKELS